MKKMFIAVLTMLMVLSFATVASARNYSGQWYSTAVNFIEDNDGYDWTFKPAANANRGQMAHLLVECDIDPSDLPNLREIDSEGFNDTTGQHGEDANLLKKAGLLAGYGDGSFGQNRSFTREEAAQVLFRAIQGYEAKHGDYSADFSDVSDNRWSNNAIGFCQENNLMIGYPDGSFKPARPLTQSELSQIVYNIHQQINYISVAIMDEESRDDAEKGEISDVDVDVDLDVDEGDELYPEQKIGVSVDVDNDDYGYTKYRWSTSSSWEKERDDDFDIRVPDEDELDDDKISLYIKVYNEDDDVIFSDSWEFDVENNGKYDPKVDENPGTGADVVETNPGTGSDPNVDGNPGTGTDVVETNPGTGADVVETNPGTGADVVETNPGTGGDPGVLISPGYGGTSTVDTRPNTGGNSGVLVSPGYSGNSLIEIAPGYSGVLVAGSGGNSLVEIAPGDSGVLQR